MVDADAHSRRKMQRAIAILDAEIDRKEPMRFIRHRDIHAAIVANARRHVAALSASFRETVQADAEAHIARLLNAGEYRGGPLVV